MHMYVYIYPHILVYMYKVYIMNMCIQFIYARIQIYNLKYISNGNV